MSLESSTESLVMRYLRAWQVGDLEALRACLADEIRFDWGVEVYTDPDEFVAASATGIEWRDVTVLSVLLSDTRAAVVYEGVNHTDGVRIRASEHLTIHDGLISEAVVVFSNLGPPRRGPESLQERTRFVPAPEWRSPQEAAYRPGQPPM